jgi:hypothetical protein
MLGNFGRDEGRVSPMFPMLAVFAVLVVLPVFTGLMLLMMMVFVVVSMTVMLLVSVMAEVCVLSVGRSLLLAFLDSQLEPLLSNT